MSAHTIEQYIITVLFDPQPEGGYTVTCEELPELITEGDSMDEALGNAIDAFKSTCALYEHIGRALPESIVASRQGRSRIMSRFGMMNPKPLGDSFKTPVLFQSHSSKSSIGAYV